MSIYGIRNALDEILCKHNAYHKNVSYSTIC